jgi:hypothetical protein
MAQPGDFAYTVKTSVDIVRVIGEYVRLKRRSGSNYAGLCPFHQEKTPSFSVSGQYQFYHCFGCGAKGDVFRFVMEMDRLTFPEAVRAVAEKNGIAVPKRTSPDSDPQARLRAQIFEQSRPGYYATVVPKPPETVQERIDREVSSAETVNELSATVRVSSASGEGGQITIDVNIKVDANRLKFVEKDDRQVQQLTFVTLLEDGQGHLITGKQAVMDLALTPGKLAEMRADGIKVETTFSAAKGAYQVREIVREVVENHWAISNTPVEVP